jgi:hypothetical protein
MAKKRIPEELAIRETSQPKQEFRFSLTIKTTRGNLIETERMRNFVANILEEYSVSHGFKIEIGSAEEHMNRSLNPQLFTDDELLVAFSNNDYNWKGKATLLQLIKEHREKIVLYYDADSGKVKAYER